MKRVLCKSAVFLLSILLLLPMLFACGGESDEVILAEAKTLLAKSAVVNALCFGEGLAPVAEGGFSSGGYTEADAASLEKYGVASVADIRALASAVYSVAAIDQLEQIIFVPVQSEGGFASYRRYYDAQDGERAVLMVKREYTPVARGEVRYENIRVAENGRNRAKILVDITVTDGERSRTLKDESFSLRREEGGWRLDTLTYASVD